MDPISFIANEPNAERPGANEMLRLSILRGKKLSILLSTQFVSLCSLFWDALSWFLLLFCTKNVWKQKN